MAVITSSRESILAQDYCNKVSGLSPGRKDRQSIFEFTVGAKALGIWNTLLIWPSRLIHNSSSTLISLGGLGEFNALRTNNNITVQDVGVVSLSAGAQCEALLPQYLTSDYFNASGFSVFYCVKTDNHGVITRINSPELYDPIESGGDRIYRSISLESSLGLPAHQMRVNNIPENFISRTGGWSVPAFYNTGVNNSSFQVHQFNYNPNSSFTSFTNGVSNFFAGVGGINTTFISPSSHYILSPIEKVTGQLEAVFGRLNYTGTLNPNISGVTAFYGIIPTSSAPNLYSLLRNTLGKGLSLPEPPPLSAIFQPPTRSNYEYLNTEFNNSASVQSDNFYVNSKPQFSSNDDYLIGNFVPVPENSVIVLDLPFTNSATNPPVDQSGFNRVITNQLSPFIQSTIVRPGKSFAGESRGRANNDPAGPAHSLGHWTTVQRTNWNSLTASFGVECWVYLPSANLSYALDPFGGSFITDHNSIWGLGGPSSDGPGLLVFNNSTLTDSRLRINFGNSTSNQIIADEQFPLNRWVHTCLIHQKSITKTLLYVDGRLIIENYGSVFNSSGVLANHRLNIGARDHNTYRGFNRPLRGYLSNFRVYHAI